LDKDPNYEISVLDNGVGISANNIQQLFRLDTKLTTEGTFKEKGTGLGLILCKEFIEKHGGKIWVESKVGQGSEFKFTLPKYGS
jgi:two-component system, sensor histidine kinase and response regulator